jgi:hypothetical protein
MGTAHSGNDRKSKVGKRTEFYIPQLIFKTAGFGQKGIARKMKILSP